MLVAKGGGGESYLYMSLLFSFKFLTLEYSGSTGTMRSVDLFSGIGGITYALRGIAAPLLYCEIDPFCQRVLKKNMKKGNLPVARIHPDVATLAPKTVKGAVDIIVAGFPCTGFSQMGGLAGFDNPGSVLFQHVVRLTKAWRPPFVFMENVPPILSMGMPALTDAFVRMGYDLRWCVWSGKDVGAPHERRRWFCLAIRRSVPEALKRVTLSHGYSFCGWNAAEPVARMVPELMKFDHKRCGALGNAVIPHVVRTAFVYLFTGMPQAFDLRGVNQAQDSELVFQAVAIGGEPGDRTFVRSLLKKYPRQGHLSWEHPDTVWGKTIHSIQSNDIIRDRQLVFDPSVYTPPASVPPSPKRSMPSLGAPKRKPLWSTPRYSCTTSSHVPTERNIRDLPTQLRFERGTPAELRGGWANPAFIEWMMGFPLNWTRVQRANGRVGSGDDADG